MKNLLLLLLISFTYSCIPGPYTSKGQDQQLRSYKKSELSQGWILINIEKWEKSKRGEVWSRDVEWYDTQNCCWHMSSAVALDYNEKSIEINKNSFLKLIYVGPWKYVKSLEKEIRLIASQDIRNQGIGYGFESKNSHNSKIKEKDLSLISNPNYGSNRTLTELKWFINHGYNGVAESYLEVRPGFWNWLLRNKRRVITGRIIEAEE